MFEYKLREEVQNEQIREKLDNIRKQFLCAVPLENFNWNNILPDLTTYYQEVLIAKTIASDLVAKYPIRKSYQRAFIKYLVQKLEEQGSEIDDACYLAYSKVVGKVPDSSEYFKHYYIQKSGNIVTLKENVNIISGGTTGLRTWQASIALSEWALQNDDAFKNKTILELGSGVGLTGLTLFTECSPSCLHLTDCHSSVLEYLRFNLKLNIEKKKIINNQSDTMVEVSSQLQRIKNRSLYSNVGNSNIFLFNLPWEDINEEKCLKLGTINKVIAADVVYDPDLFEPLIEGLKCLSNFCGVEEFIFSCTERNKETLETFLKHIGAASFTIEELEVPSQENFIWPTNTPIRIFRFTA